MEITTTNIDELLERHVAYIDSLPDVPNEEPLKQLALRLERLRLAAMWLDGKSIDISSPDREFLEQRMAEHGSRMFKMVFPEE